MSLKTIIEKIYHFYCTRNSKRLLRYYKNRGVRIGKGTFILDPKHIQLDISRPELLEIGENVFLHRGTIILTHDWASWCFVNSHNEFFPSHGKVKIGNNVWLGENVTVLKGVTIGDNVIIGIGSIVTKDIPSNSVAVGIPAKVVETYEEYYRKRKENYVNECVEYAKEILKSGRQLRKESFYDDYSCFVDGSNYQDYDYPYSVIFNQVQFEQWKMCHKKVFDGFDDFIKYVKNRNNERDKG